MSRLQQILICFAVLAMVATAPAQTNALMAPRVSEANTNLIPPPAILVSPVDFFRRLLLMPAAERNEALAKRTPESRKMLVEKIREYQQLSLEERELRLRATELRWYITPLLRAPAEEYEARLAQVPPDYRQLIKTRLIQWQLLPPSMKSEFLANEKTLNYVAHIAVSNTPAANARQQKAAEAFGDFLALTPGEKKKLLGTLSSAERTQMEKTLKAFDGLPPEKRELCERSYARFAGLSEAERAEFLKNAENWSQMSPLERKAWRDLVANVPLWPPVPTAMVKPTVSTNFAR